MSLTNALAAYVLTAMLAWSPVSGQARRGESAEHAVERYRSIADDIAYVALDQDEPPAVRGEGVQARVRSAILMASLAFWESSFWVDVDEGRCRKELGARCDEGNAFTIWQLHPQDGFVLHDGRVSYASQRPGAPAVSGEELVRDRRLAARVVHRMIKANGVAQWTPGKRAQGHAAAWLRAHPFRAP